MRESYSDELLDFLMAGIRGKDASEAFHWLRLRVRKLESKVECMKRCAKGGRHDVRSFNVGESDYSSHGIQPWDIWIEYGLNPFDADIVKRVLRTKVQSGKSAVQSRIEDYNKIIHICRERVRQLSEGVDSWGEFSEEE